MVLHILGTKLLSEGGRKHIDIIGLDTVPIVGLYFTASWCPPCKMFTPTLIRAYNEINEVSRFFEIVTISADEYEEDFKQDVKEMPWLAAAFDLIQLERIAEHYNVSTIPTLLILNKDGGVKVANAKTLIEEQGASVIYTWRQTA
jgi:nucleoredoxin